MASLSQRRVSRRRFLLGAGATAALAAASGRWRTASAAAAGVSWSADEPADMVLRGGKIITVDPSDTIAQAIALKDGLVQAVGTDEEVAGLIGEATQVVDLGGRAVTPGLIDSHIHLQGVGLMDTYFLPFMPPKVKSVNDMRTELAAVSAQTPKGEWIKGYFLALTEGRLPTRQDLDPATADHPVWMMQQGGHYGSANTRALQIANITSKTLNPEGGVVDRDAQGNPTGVFYNHRAMDLLRSHIPLYTPEMALDNVTSSQPMFAACGVTSFQDTNIRGVDNIDMHREIGKQGTTTLRGATYYTLEWPGDLQRALKIAPFDDQYMRFAGFKFLIDGQADMAFTLEPHSGTRWNMSTWDAPTFKKTVRALHETGLQIAVHCGGDAALNLVLDAYEEAMNASPRPDPRHRIEHCVLSKDWQTQRMKDLGVVVATQPQFVRVGGDYWAKLFGEERIHRTIVTREWLEADVPVALGSDAPTTPWYAPQVTLAGAVARPTLSGKTLAPEQALTIKEALRAHTMGSAYAVHEEGIKGSLEVGKLADLAVWPADPYNTPMQKLWDMRVEMTLIGGKVVHDSGNESLRPRAGADVLGG